MLSVLTKSSPINIPIFSPWMEPAETGAFQNPSHTVLAVTRFTRGHFSELIRKYVGGEGVLYAAKHDIHGNVMVKVFTSPDNKYSEEEVRTLEKVTCHQNIVRILGSFYFEDGTDAMRHGYVMEFMANGSLSAVIHDPSIQYSDSQVYTWIQQAGEGIAYLHSQNIIHRDVNTKNMKMIVYMAPETINEQGVNSAADVYSLGISTWEMFHRKKPFYEHDSLSRFSLAIRIITGTRPKIELRMKEDLENLILRSLEAQYKLRPRASDFATIDAQRTSLAPILPVLETTLREFKEADFCDIFSHSSNYVGNGSGGTVYRRKHPTYGKVAVKYLSTHCEERSKIREITSALIRHPGIVNFYGFLYQNKKVVGFVMEYLETDLKNVILDTNYTYSLVQLVHWMVDIAGTLAEMHKRRIIHRDIKPANILLHYDEKTKSLGAAKLCDFGLSREISSRTKTYGIGTKNYMAPEIREVQGSPRLPYNEKVDVFSLGVVLWELLHRKFRSDGGADAIFDICSELRNVMESCMFDDPDRRPTMTELKKQLEENPALK